MGINASTQRNSLYRSEADSNGVKLASTSSHISDAESEQAKEKNDALMDQLLGMVAQLMKGDLYAPKGSQNSPHAPSAETPQDGRNEDMQCLHTLQMHRDRLPKKMRDGDIDKMINDDKTPEDLKKELRYLKDPANKAFKHSLDTELKGGQPDGNISCKDIDKASARSGQIEYGKRKAESYTHNYVPSDAQQEDALPREITEADAAREMYLYSDGLPKHIDLDLMKKIASGQATGQAGKYPPQLIASAQYYAKNPDKFKKAIGGDETNRDYMQDHLIKQVRLTEDEQKTIKSINKNQDVFFKDGKKITRDNIEKIAKDEDQKPEIRKDANQLLKSPLVYGMLDNAAKGHGTNLVKNNNDGQISKEDGQAAEKNLTEANISKAPAPVKAHKPRTTEDMSAAKDMGYGMMDDPNIKASEGGALKKFGQTLGKVFSKALDIGKNILDFVGGLKIPIFSQLAQAGSVSIAAANDLGLKPALERAEKGTSVKESEINGAKTFGMDMASTGMSAVVPGAGAAVMGGAKGALKGGVDGAKEGAKQGLKEGAELGSKSSGTIVKAGATGVGISQGMALGTREVPKVYANYQEDKLVDARAETNVKDQSVIANDLVNMGHEEAEKRILSQI